MLMLRGKVKGDSVWRVATVPITANIAFFRGQEISHLRLLATLRGNLECLNVKRQI